MSAITVYCTVEDVQRWVKRTQFTEESKVTKLDVNFYIQTACSVLDGELVRLGVSLPVPTSATRTMQLLKTLTSLEAASLAESAVVFGGTKAESLHGTYLHTKYLDLLNTVITNPGMLSDVVTGSVAHMKSTTEDMLVGGTKEGDEIFTEKAILDFVTESKVLSASEKTTTEGSITGNIDPTRV